VREEEEQLFPELRKTRLDLGALGRQLAKRKNQLQAKLPTDVGDRS
jgi:hypothetical protein